MRKKKRSAAQIAATKKLVAFNKARSNKAKRRARDYPQSKTTAQHMRDAKKASKKVVRRNPAHKYKGHGIARIKPGSTGLLQYMSAPYSTWGPHREAMSFSSVKHARFAAQKCGSLCAIVGLAQNRDAEIAALLRGEKSARKK